MQRNLIFKVSSHNDLTTHDHISPHKKFVYTSPIFSFSSYDTEALNKSCNELYSDIEFENRFQHTQHKKINTGIQQLYIIGLYDALPVQELLDIFGTYLPPPLFLTLKRYVTPNEPDRRRDRPITIHWPRFLAKLGEGCHTAFACHHAAGRVHLFRADFGRRDFAFPVTDLAAASALADDILRQILPR